DLVLRNLNVHSWQYLNVSDPEMQLKLRHYRIDWSLLLKDAITDVVIRAGREDILGVVEHENIANKSHDRMGFRPIDEATVFESDGGKAASVMGRRVFSIFQSKQAPQS
ncbi:MAG: hypothetical protein KDD62_02820, partial [Bdellovibrionales bacterium]|nr:hypothetical protein [Bdellovibrionales bacterium]